MAAPQTIGKHSPPSCLFRYQVWCFMVTIFSFWAVSSCALETWWWEVNDSRLENCLSFACLLPYVFLCVLFAGRKAVVRPSSAWLCCDTLCVKRRLQLSPLQCCLLPETEMCRWLWRWCWPWQIDSCVSLGMLTLFKVPCPSCLRLVLSRRQPEIWFECDFRVEDWLYGSCKHSFTISSSRAGGSAHLVWCFKTCWFSDDIFMIQFALCLYQNTYRYHNGTKCVASLVLPWFSMFLLMVTSFPTELLQYGFERDFSVASGILWIRDFMP